MEEVIEWRLETQVVPSSHRHFQDHDRWRDSHKQRSKNQGNIRCSGEEIC